jgi:flagella basal body P-ring formation protein FlgA
MIKYLSFLAFLFCFSSWACEVSLPGLMVVMGEGQSTTFFTQKNCTEANISDLYQLVTTLDGRISSTQLSEMMAARGQVGMQFTPYMIQVNQMKSIMREQMNLPAGIQVKSTRSVNMGNILALAPGDQLSLSCDACLYGSQQVVNIDIKGFDGTQRSLVVSADFSKMVKAYRTLTYLNSFSDLNEQTLKEEYVEAIPQTDLVSDITQLKFFKTNKPIKNGELLRFSDLNAVNLVKAGLKTDVIIENQMVRIKTSGISRNNGTFGELVEVYHAQKNKKYQGRVIDVNKVLVEL